MNVVEYLVSYGLQGAFGRFRPLRPLACRRGDRAVVRSSRGLELGEVLREATPRHAHFLPNTTVGQLLRLPSEEDERQDRVMRQCAQQLLQRGARLAQEQDLPFELIDAEVLLDGEHALVHHLCWQECDVRPFVSTLSREFAMQIALADLTAPQQESEAPGCGSCGAGGCGSCGSGGGCGSCGSADPQEVQAYFAQLRQKMERRHTLL